MPKPNRGATLKWREERGAWEIVWYERGRQRRRSTGTGSRDEADQALGRFLLQRDRDTAGPRDPSERRIAEVLAAYADEKGSHAVDPARIGYAIKALLTFWVSRHVGDINEPTCRAYMRSRKAAAGTVRKELGTLKAAINYDFEQGRLTGSPPVWLPQKPEAKDRWLTRNEAAALLMAARKDPRARLHLPLFILIGLYTGARKEAILSLRWPQVDLERRLIDFNPPGRARTSKGRPIIPIPTRLLTFLRHARKRGSTTGSVISQPIKQPDGTVIRGPIANIKHAFATAACRAGMGEFEEIETARGVERAARAEITPHVLRHTCATWMTMAGVPFPVIARFLGHSDSRITESVYAHHAPDYLDAAVAALDGRVMGVSRREQNGKRRQAAQMKL